MGKIKLIAMDLDGTLTQHKSQLEPANRAALDALGQKCRLVMVGAGSCERIYHQLGDYPIDVIGNYGMQYGEVINGSFQLLQDDSAPVDRQSVVQKVEFLRDKFNLHDFAGETVEFHASGMITFPILGTKAVLKDKLAYDPDRQKRRAMYDVVAETFADYAVFVGGTSSFDIVPHPYNKLYALQQYAEKKGFNMDEIVYFGDDYGLGGNDEHIYKSDIKFVEMENYLDFAAEAREIEEVL